MNDDNKGVRWFAVKTRARINRGLSWIDYIRYIAYSSLAIMGLDTAAKGFGVTIRPDILAEIYVVLPVLLLSSAYLIGYLDECYGLWKLEAIWGNRDVNPFMKNLEEKIEEIHKELIKLKK